MSVFLPYCYLVSLVTPYHAHFKNIANTFTYCYVSWIVVQWDLCIWHYSYWILNLVAIVIWRLTCSWYKLSFKPLHSIVQIRQCEMFSCNYINQRELDQMTSPSNSAHTGMVTISSPDVKGHKRRHHTGARLLMSQPLLLYTCTSSHTAYI